MVVTFENIPELSTGKVLFVSARLGRDLQLEFEKFDAKVFPEPRHVTERQIIYKTILEIGRRGARPFFFRQEGPAVALPGSVDQAVMDANLQDFGLRVYGGLLGADLVLLLNGGIKTKLDPKECPNVGPHFKNAQKIMRVLLKANSDGYVRFTSAGIELDQDYDIEI